MYRSLFGSKMLKENYANAQLAYKWPKLTKNNKKNPDQLMQLHNSSQTL